MRTLAGKEIWTGPALAGGGASSSFARVEVPASALSPGDYIVSLFDTAASGSARDRYFLRVRAR